MKTLTKAQLQEQHVRERHAAYCQGIAQGRGEMQKEMEQSFSHQKREAYASATKLLEEAGRMMSRAGYMIGKINGDNQR